MIEKPELILEIDIMCINCQSLIKFEMVEQHSKVCQNISEKVKNMESPFQESSSEVEIRNVSFKIEKLKLAIESKLKTQRNEIM